MLDITPEITGLDVTYDIRERPSPVGRDQIEDRGNRLRKSELARSSSSILLLSSVLTVCSSSLTDCSSSLEVSSSSLVDCSSSLTETISSFAALSSSNALSYSSTVACRRSLVSRNS